MNCLSRLLFKKFKHTWTLKESSLNKVDGSRIDVEGRFTSLSPKLDFTEKQLRCGRINYNYANGWARRGLNAINVNHNRTLTQGYPFPELGQGIGSSIDGYFFTRWPPTHIIPYFNTLKVEGDYPRSWIDRITGIDNDGTIYTQAASQWFKVKAEEFPLKDKDNNPLKGDPPIQPYEEARLGKEILNQLSTVVSYNGTVFESRAQMNKWIDSILTGTKFPVYYPGAPNDDSLPNKQKPTVFDTKDDFLNFIENVPFVYNQGIQGNRFDYSTASYALVGDQQSTTTTTTTPPEGGGDPVVETVNSSPNCSFYYHSEANLTYDGVVYPPYPWVLDKFSQLNKTAQIQIVEGFYGTNFGQLIFGDSLNWIFRNFQRSNYPATLRMGFYPTIPVAGVLEGPFVIMSKKANGATITGTLSYTYDNDFVSQSIEFESKLEWESVTLPAPAG
jgi:hypothetical protein